MQKSVRRALTVAQPLLQTLFGVQTGAPRPVFPPLLSGARRGSAGAGVRRAVARARERQRGGPRDDAQLDQRSSNFRPSVPWWKIVTFNRSLFLQNGPVRQIGEHFSDTLKHFSKRATHSRTFHIRRNAVHTERASRLC